MVFTGFECHQAIGEGRMLKIVRTACLVGMQACIVNLHCVGVKCHGSPTLPHSFVRDDWIGLKVLQVISAIAISSFLM